MIVSLHDVTTPGDTRGNHKSYDSDILRFAASRSDKHNAVSRASSNAAHHDEFRVDDDEVHFVLTFLWYEKRAPLPKRFPMTFVLRVGFWFTLGALIPMGIIVGCRRTVEGT